MKRKNARAWRRTAAAVVAVCCAVMAVALLIDWIDAHMQAHEIDVIRQQIRRAAISCYASEGRYPQEVSYLVEHYGLVYDESRYSILYDAFASNIMPDINVLVKGE